MSKIGKRNKGARKIASGLKQITDSGMVAGLKNVRGIVVNQKIAKAAKKNGRKADYDAARSSVKENAKELFLNTHPLTATVRGVKKVMEGVKQLFGNHPEWYENYPLNGLINLNFGRRKGIEEHIYSSKYQTKVASAAGLDIILTKSKDDSDSWNQAIQFLYSTIRAANSGSVNFNMAELESYVISLRSLHALYCVGRRAYATLLNMDIYDGTTPKSLLNAQGLDYDTFAANAANLKQYGTLWSETLHKLCPLNVDLINRTRWMFSNGFADSNDAKSTPYFFRLRAFPYFNGTDYVTTGATASPSASQGGMKYDDFIKLVQTVFTSFTSNNVFAVIAGDIIKAFGENALYPSEIWGDNFSTPIIYDEAALTQIQNATLGCIDTVNYSMTYSDTAFAVNTLTLVQGLQADVNWFENAALPYLDKKFINSYKDSCTPGEAISFTRLAWFGSGSYANSKYTVTPSVYGTEVVAGLIICFYDVSSTNPYKIAQSALSGIECVPFPLNSVTYSNDQALVSQLDWAPAVCFAFYNSAGTVVTTDAMMDLNNYALIDSKTQLAQFHAYASLSLLAVPNIAKLNNVTLLS